MLEGRLIVAKLIYSAITSLDGYIDDADGRFDSTSVVRDPGCSSEQTSARSRIHVVGTMNLCPRGRNQAGCALFLLGLSTPPARTTLTFVRPRGC